MGTRTLIITEGGQSRTLVVGTRGGATAAELQRLVAEAAASKTAAENAAASAEETK